jgi:hypothetical protein
MPKQRPTVASFWVHRPVEHPGAADYPAMLRILDRSCAGLGMRHVVLTDHATLASDRWPEGIEGWASDLPSPLMQACTEAQARYLESLPESDVLFVGADCIFVGDPAKVPAGPALALTYRHPAANYPINNGFMLARRHSMEKVAELYRRVADRTGARWCDDQRAIRAELEPMPDDCGIHERAGLQVAFLPMKTFNRLPKTIDDPCRDAVMLHFRGKQHATGQHRKDMLFAWAKRHGYA